MNIYKLKNRGLGKKEEKKIKEISYSMLGEDIIELPKNDFECEKISEFRSIYLNLKIAVEDAKIEKKILNDDIKFKFEGTILDFKKYRKILDDLIPEFSHSLSKLYGRDICIKYSGKLNKGKSIVTFTLKEAN